MPRSKAKSVEQRRRERAAYMRRRRQAETPEAAAARRAADRAARAAHRAADRAARVETPEAARQRRPAMKKRMKRRRAKEKERAAEAEKRPASAAVDDIITSAPVRPQERSVRRRPLLGGGPEGVRVVEPLPPPPPGGELLRLSLSLKRSADAIGACAAQALGFHAAAMAANAPERLTAIIRRAAAMLKHLGALEQVRREAAALHADLQSVKAQLAAAADRQVAAGGGRSPRWTLLRPW